MASRAGAGPARYDPGRIPQRGRAAPPSPLRNRRLDSITADDLAAQVRDMRNRGKSEATIAAVLGAAGRIYKFAARRLGFSGTNPITLMLSSERPKVSLAKQRPIFTRDQIEQTLAAATEPYRTLFTVAALTGARVSASMRHGAPTPRSPWLAFRTGTSAAIGPSRSEAHARRGRRRSRRGVAGL